MVRHKVPAAQLVVAGPTVAGKESYAAGLERRAVAAGGVHWLGQRDDMPELLADLDALAAPSTFPEPFGLVLIEALASGVPVVGTDAGGAVEIAARAAPEAVHLVPPGDPAALAAALVAHLGHDRQPRSQRAPLWKAQTPDWPALYQRTLKGN